MSAFQSLGNTLQSNLKLSPRPCHFFRKSVYMAEHDVSTLEHLLENAEHNDAEAHKLYNNLGLAHAANRDFRRSLNAHREEKKICKRLLGASPEDPLRHLDLAIAYRRCGDAMLKLDRLIDSRNEVISKRDDVIREAHSQHVKGLEITRKAPRTFDARPSIQLEMQAASAAIAQSSLALALFTQKRAHFAEAAKAAAEATRMANRLVVGTAGLSYDAKLSLLFGIAINYAISISGLGEKKRARTLLHTVSIRAREIDDHSNLVRALSNLSEDASEENEWELCEAYAREWARLAKKAGDACDEADALRKVAVVLHETGDLQGAEEALIRSRRLHNSEEGRREADNFLSVIHQEMDDHEQAKEHLEINQQQADNYQQQGDYIEEAKCRIIAGNGAFVLRKSELVIQILGRYFELVDEYGCNPSVTSVEESVHNSAIANMGESYWNLKKYEEAVHWASRELSVFDGDPPGQAQAWCNLGVYLDDFGKKEKAADALRRSIAIAESCGEIETKTRAENNLLVVEQELEAAQEKQNLSSTQAALTGNDIDARKKIGNVEKKRQSGEVPRKSRDGPVVTAEHPSVLAIDEGGGERSIVMDSSQPMIDGKVAVSRKTGINAQNISSERELGRTCSSTHLSMRGCARGGEQSVSIRSRDRVTDSFTPRGTDDITDVAGEYRRVCERADRSGGKVRPMIVSAFRDLSSAILSLEARGQHDPSLIKLNLRALLVSNADVVAVLETLSVIGVEYSIALDLSFNPFIGMSAFDLNIQKVGPPITLYAVKQIDLSCAGITPNIIRRFSDLLGEGKLLCHVSSISFSKNGLGRHGSRDVARSILRMLVSATTLRSLDLSLNLFSNDFLPQLTAEMINGDIKNSPSSLTLENLDLRLNNRRKPTGLLESVRPADAVDYLNTLFNTLPLLKSVDLRACGAARDVRRALGEMGDSYTGRSRHVVTLTDVSLDDQIMAIP